LNILATSVTSTRNPEVHAHFGLNLIERCKRKLAVGASLMICAMALSSCNEAASAEGSPPAADVDVAAVVVKKIRYWDEFNGRISAINSVDLRPRVTGYIDKVAYRDGQVVRRGDLLFTIDPRPYQAALESAEARLERAKAIEAVAKIRNERALALLRTQAISKEEGDDRGATYDQARADVLDAAAALDLAKLNLSYTEVRAPIDGRVGRAMLTPGNLAVSDQTLLTSVVSQNPVYVDFDPDEHSFLKYVADAKNNAMDDGALNVQVGLANETGFPHQGKVDFLDNKLDSATGSIRLRAELSNDQNAFTPGLFARVQVSRDVDADAILVDDKAVLTDQNRRYVWVLGPDSTASRKDVVAGRMVDGLRVIEEGLEPTDKIIVSGLQRIFMTGMPVKPSETTMTNVASR
jgi:multidrug efflux system membrane fusion protein